MQIKEKIIQFKFSDNNYAVLWEDFTFLYTIGVNPDDRDPIEIYEKAIKINESQLFLIYLGEELIGFYLIDVHPTFNILNHILILRKYRKQGYGLKLINHLKHKSMVETKILIAESTVLIRDIYFKNGFKQLEVKFYSPSFAVDGKLFSFYLMVWSYNFLRLNTDYDYFRGVIIDIYKNSYYLPENDDVVQKTLSTLKEPITLSFKK